MVAAAGRAWSVGTSEAVEVSVMILAMAGFLPGRYAAAILVTPHIIL
jgi:hypothetical protein